MLNQEEENKIMYYNCKGDYKNLYRYLFKLLNTREYNSIDAWRITYDLANCSYRINNIDNAKKYINMSIEFMNQVTELGYDQKKAYTIWLYLYIYQDELTKEESLKEYYKIKKMLYFGKEDELIIADEGYSVTEEPYKSNSSHTQGTVSSKNAVVTFDLNKQTLNFTSLDGEYFENKYSGYFYGSSIHNQ